MSNEISGIELTVFVELQHKYKLDGVSPIITNYLSNIDRLYRIIPN